MKTLVNVARYHMVDRLQYVAMPWIVLTFTFLVNVAIFAVVPAPERGKYTGALLTIYIFLFVLGIISMSRALPFGLSLGVSRRSYYLGTALLVLAMGVGYALVLTVLQLVESATAGWGMALHFFRVPWILDGPWYLSWLTSFVLLVLLFVYGMWFGLVYRRWNVTGMIFFVAAQVLVLLAAVVVISLTGNWPAVGEFFGAVTVPGLTGVLAALAVVLGIGGYTTLRRVTV